MRLDHEVRSLQRELVIMQKYVRATELKPVVIFEGAMPRARLG
jgi:polyphosphate kinase 2 (PPK2 family)